MFAEIINEMRTRVHLKQNAELHYALILNYNQKCLLWG